MFFQIEAYLNNEMVIWNNHLESEMTGNCYIMRYSKGNPQPMDEFVAIYDEGDEGLFTYEGYFDFNMQPVVYGIYGTTFKPNSWEEIMRGEVI